jgi:hypothetical protein
MKYSIYRNIIHFVNYSSFFCCGIKTVTPKRVCVSNGAPAPVPTDVTKPIGSPFVLKIVSPPTARGKPATGPYPIWWTQR